MEHDAQLLETGVLVLKSIPLEGIDSDTFDAIATFVSIFSKESAGMLLSGSRLDKSIPQQILIDFAHFTWNNLLQFEHAIPPFLGWVPHVHTVSIVLFPYAVESAIPTIRPLSQ